MACSVLWTVLHRGVTPTGIEEIGVARHCSSAAAVASGAEEWVRERVGKERGEYGKVGFISALQQIEVRVNAGSHDSVCAGRETSGDWSETMGTAVGKAARRSGRTCGTLDQLPGGGEPRAGLD
jgi:hypothetical protein